MTITARLLTSLALLTLSACQADAPRDKPEQTGLTPDSGTGPAEVAAPRLIGIPAATPLATVAIRGTTEGSSLVIKGGANGTHVLTPLPSGDFCADVPLGDGGAATIEVTSLADGKVSAPARVTVTRDPTAAEPADPYCTAPLCVGGSCPEQETDCNDDQDNDFDGWTDQCDIDCSGCIDDAYEPNDYPASVPTLEEGSYIGLRICPCHDDWYALYLEEDERLRLTAFRDEGRVSTKLFRAEDAEDGGYKSKLPVSTGLLSGDTVKITWTATETGWYYLYAYSLDAEQAASYRLSVYVY